MRPSTMSAYFVSTMRERLPLNAPCSCASQCD